MRKKKKLLNSILATVSVLLVIAVAMIFVGSNFLKTKDRQIMELEQEITENKKVLYVASKFIERGETIEDGVNVMPQEVYTGLEGFNFITLDDMGKVACIDIEEKVPILTSMVAPSSITQDTREYEMRVAHVATDQTDNDLVDIRIMFPSGEDYLVLAKKQVKNLSLEASQFTCDLNEEEIVRMASATVDAFTVTGTRIYTTRYVEGNLQEAAIPNYLVRQQTIDLINSDPNILTKAQETLNKFARLELEERLSAMSEEALTAVSDGHGLADTAGGKALLGQEGKPAPEEPVEAPAEEGTGLADTAGGKALLGQEGKPAPEEPVEAPMEEGTGLTKTSGSDAKNLGSKTDEAEAEIESKEGH